MPLMTLHNTAAVLRNIYSQPSLEGRSIHSGSISLPPLYMIATTKDISKHRGFLSQAETGQGKTDDTCLSSLQQHWLVTATSH